MIKGITVRSFQSLKRLDLSLGQLTIVVGESDVGKSALLRAFRAVARNPDGSSFVTVGDSEACVVLRLSEGDVVWRKGKTAVYQLNGTDYSRFGRGSGNIPQEIAEFLRLSSISLDERVVFEVHFADQFDVPFLVDETGSKLARILGELIRAGNVLEAVDLGRDQSRNAGTEVKVYQQQIEDLDRSLEALPDEKAIPLSDLTQRLETLSVRIACHQELTSLLISKRTLERRAAPLAAHLPTLAGMLPRLHKTYSRITTLAAVLPTHRAILSQAHDLQTRIASLEERMMIQIPSSEALEVLFEQVQRLIGYKALVAEALKLSMLSMRQSQTLFDLDVEIQKKKQDLHDLEDELKVCPVCEQPFGGAYNHA